MSSALLRQRQATLRKEFHGERDRMLERFVELRHGPAIARTIAACRLPPAAAMKRADGGGAERNCRRDQRRRRRPPMAGSEASIAAKPAPGTAVAAI
ncbi:MAG: hypothetical protein ACO3Y3_10120 [Phycisphaerales bacterium]